MFETFKELPEELEFDGDAGEVSVLFMVVEEEEAEVVVEEEYEEEAEAEADANKDDDDEVLEKGRCAESGGGIAEGVGRRGENKAVLRSAESVVPGLAVGAEG